MSASPSSTDSADYKINGGTVENSLSADLNASPFRTAVPPPYITIPISER